jgi:uncharacterized protein (DUF58 family)
MSSFFLFILVLFALAALLRIDFFFTILYLFVGVYVVSHLWSRRTFSQLRLTRRLQERAFLGDTVEVTLKLEAGSHLPIPWLLLTESFPVVLSAPPFFRTVISLAGKSSHTLRYQLHARQRGYYKIGPLILQSGDLLGIKQDLTARLEPDYLIVYPKVLPLSALGLPTHSPQVVLATPLPLFQDPARIIGVHDYHPGDNPRHIHWPASASTSQVLVKQFQPAIARDNAIFLNLDREDYARQSYPDPPLELAIIVAASLANHMISFEKLPVGLVTTAMDPLIEQTHLFNLPPRKGRGQLIQILEVLARVQAVKETYFLETMRQQAVHLSWGTTLIIITTGLESEELLQTILLLKRAGFQVSLVLIYPPAHQQRSEGRIRHLDVPVFRIRQEKDVEAWLPAQ